MAAITDPRYGEARFSLGRIEGWIESVSKDFKLVPTNVLKDLNAVEEALRYFARSAAKFMHVAQEKEKDVKTQSLKERTEGTHVAVVLSPNFDLHEAETFGDYYIHTQRANGIESMPSKAFRNKDGVCMEMNPMPIPYTFTLPELQSIVRLLEARQKDLPWNDANEGYNR